MPKYSDHTDWSCGWPDKITGPILRRCFKRDRPDQYFCPKCVPIEPEDRDFCEDCYSVWSAKYRAERAREKVAAWAKVERLASERTP